MSHFDKARGCFEANQDRLGGTAPEGSAEQQEQWNLYGGLLALANGLGELADRVNTLDNAVRDLTIAVNNLRLR